MTKNINNDKTIIMATIRPISIIDSLSGKVSKDSNVYFATKKRTGKVYTGMICSQSHHIPTEAQIAARSQFIIRINTIKAWVEKNRPNETRPNGTEEFQKMMLYYSIGNWRTFLFKYLPISNPDF